MSVPSVISRGAARHRGPTDPPVSRTVAGTQRPPEVATQPLPALELDSIAARWQLALDAAERALVAAGESLPSAELVLRRRRLVQERQHTAEMLMRLARVSGVRPLAYSADQSLTDVDVHASLEQALVLMRHKVPEGVRVVRAEDPFVVGQGARVRDGQHAKIQGDEVALCSHGGEPNRLPV